MTIDHVAIAVASIDEAADRLTKLLGYSRKTLVVVNLRQRVKVAFLEKAGSIDLKLIEPADESSPLTSFVKRGGGLHHLCFKVPDVSAAVAGLASQGVRVLSPPEPGEAFDDQPIAFCYLGLGLNIELIDTAIRRGAITS